MMPNRILDEFLHRLTLANQAVLLLDYDGTLAPFRVERDKAFPYEGVRELLTSIRRDTKTRLIIVSGRAIDDLLPLLSLTPPPEIWGCHGWEKLEEDGQRQAVNLPDEARVGLQEGLMWVKHEGLENYCEKKPASLAIHWRGLPDHKIEELRGKVNNGFRLIAENYCLQIHPFNGGLELRCPGESKGTVVKSILAGLSLDEPIAFLGDDLTDEDGFEAIKGMGIGILVNNKTRPTHADLQLKSPEDLISFLKTWRDKVPKMK